MPVTPTDTAIATVREAIDRFADSDDPAPVVAHKVIASLDPDVLAVWLVAHAERFVAEVVREIDRSKRARARWTAQRSVFADGPQSFLEARHSVGSKRLRLAEMRRADLEVLAGSYERTGRTLAFEAAFYRALADKLGENDLVGDVLTDEQIRTVRDSLTR